MATNPAQGLAAEEIKMAATVQGLCFILLLYLVTLSDTLDAYISQEYSEVSRSQQVGVCCRRFSVRELVAFLLEGQYFISFFCWR